MRVTYVGISDYRIISSDDYPELITLEEGEERREFVWGPGQTIIVPDSVGERLTQEMRNEFKATDETTRDLRTKEELYSLAQELEIPGRSEMTKEELAQAIDETQLVLDQPEES